ncbi:MAG: hypothetical protein ACK5QH_12255 [Rubrivivax sp.]|jgi:hypothetical protein
MNRSNALGPSTQQQTTGLLCAAVMTLAMLFGTHALANAPAAQATLHAKAHTVVTPA